MAMLDLVKCGQVHGLSSEENEDADQSREPGGGSRMSKRMSSTSGSVSPGGGITAKVCNFGLASELKFNTF